MTDKETTRNGWNAGYFLSGMFIGGLIGAATALLVAPQSGEETRDTIRDKGVELLGKEALSLVLLLLALLLFVHLASFT